MSQISSAIFDGWEPLVRTLLLTILAYPCLLIILRISGHRTLAKLNAFDFVITIALGSTLASIVISESVSLAQGVLGFTLLVGLQYVVAKATNHSRNVESWVNGEPLLLFHNGLFLRRAMNQARITEDEIMASVRTQGSSTLDDVAAVVLETNGNVSVVQSKERVGHALLKPVRRVL